MKYNTPLTLISKHRSSIMGFAALWILFFHMWQPLFASGSPAVLFYAENVVKRLGFEGVDIFFLLSGMGMTYAIGKHSLINFYYRRFKRLAVPFLCIAAIRAVVERWGFGGFIYVISGASFFVGNMYFCLWFVTAIAIIYLLFPMYWRLFTRARSKLVFTAFVLIIWYAVSVALIGIMREDMYGFTNRLPIFLTGVYLGWYAQNTTPTSDAPHRVYIYAAVGLTLLGLILSFMCNFRNVSFLLPQSNCCLPDYLTALGLSVLLAMLFNRLDRVGAGWIGRAFGFVGGISLEFYCVQEFLGGKTVNALAEKVPDIIVNIAVLAVVTLSAWVLFKINLLFWRNIDKFRSKKA